MKSKKFISAIVAAAIMLSMSASSFLQTKAGIAYAVEAPEEAPIEERSSEKVADDELKDGDGSEETNEGGTLPEESGKLPAPQNVTLENGFITWDEVEGAYGYIVRTWSEGEEIQQTYYENLVECNRFIHEQTYIYSFDFGLGEYTYDLDFGEYIFDVCAFDESGSRGKWSDSVAVSYAPAETVEIPKNVRLVEGDVGTVVWDGTGNEAKYNIKIYKEDGTLYNKESISRVNFWWWGWVHETGNYTIKIQAMDGNYNVSDWSEPISGTYTAPSNEAPQNVRLDESGDYVLWDAVEGASSYSVSLMNMYYYDSNGNGPGGNELLYMDASQCRSEWKSLVSPFSDKRHEIWVSVANEIGTWNRSDSITVDFTPDIDETLVIPTEIRLEDNYIVWDEVEGAAAYWTRVSAYGNFFYINGAVGVKTNNLQFGDSFPAGTYEIETAAVGKDGNYNIRVHSFELNTIPDESVWIPKLYYKFDKLEWDWDRLRHENTEYFWLRFSQDGVVVKLEQCYLNDLYVLESLLDGKYTVEICATENGKTGNWSEPFILTKHGDSLFDEKNEVTTEIETAPEAEDIPEEDRITSITINPAFNMKNKNDNNVELDLTKIKIKAKEIYDEEGLQRAAEALGETIEGNKHYNLLDLTLLYDEEDFSNGYDGLVQVVIPIPTGHRDKTFTCYRLTEEEDGTMVKEVIPGEQTEDSYIIYLEHFSIYAMVGDDEKEHTHDYGDKWESDKTGHWKECECGETSNAEEHTFGEWKTTKEATEEEEGEQTRECEVCEWTETRTVDKLTPAETSVSDTSATEAPAPETSDTSTTEPPVSETSDSSTTEPPVSETSDTSTTEPPVSETSDSSTTEPPVSETSDSSTTEPPVSETSDSSTTEPPVSETSDSSTTEPPVSETSDSSTTEPPVSETSDSSTTEPPVSETSDSSTTEPPVSETSDSSTTEPPVSETSDSSATEPPAPGTSDPITDTTVTIVDENTNITVIGENGALKDGAKLKVEDKGSEDGTARYDISLVDENGNEIQPEDGKTVTVRIPVPEGMTAENCKIYRAETDGIYTNMNCKAVTADGIEYLEFTTEHFSEYIVTERVLGTEPEPTSTTESAAAIKVPTGSFTVPNTTTVAANTTIPPETTETEPAAASSTSSEAQAASNANTETTSASIPSVYDNMGGNENIGSDNISTPGNVSNAGSNNSSHNTDKNVNTGVLISILPVAAAAVGVIISKKKK